MQEFNAQGEAVVCCHRYREVHRPVVNPQIECHLHADDYTRTLQVPCRSTMPTKSYTCQTMVPYIACPQLRMLFWSDAMHGPPLGRICVDKRLSGDSSADVTKKPTSVPKHLKQTAFTAAYQQYSCIPLYSLRLITRMVVQEDGGWLGMGANASLSPRKEAQPAAAAADKAGEYEMEVPDWDDEDLLAMQAEPMV